VANQIATSLHVPRVAILLNGGSALEPAYALGYTTVPPVPLHDSRALTYEHEREIRTALDAELLLPLSANQKLVGVMGLGPKRPEEPFTSADIRLLDAVATQTGPGIEYAGACRPALGVGGDYYDFIGLSETTLGIAIGDVSGKGIPAALLMATLRAYLRAQTIQGDSDLAAMMANLNQLVYESSAANRYATFFYGEYDAASGLLKYVNGGHNPPMLFKKAGGVVRLDVGGPVIGLIPGCA
jgi:sigma-B regulation protein RsbU (phosphoserine phosphatase)